MDAITTLYVCQALQLRIYFINLCDIVSQHLCSVNFERLKFIDYASMHSVSVSGYRNILLVRRRAHH